MLRDVATQENNINLEEYTSWYVWCVITRTKKSFPNQKAQMNGEVRALLSVRWQGNIYHHQSKTTWFHSTISIPAMCTAVLFHNPRCFISHRECFRSIASCLPDVVDLCLCHHWCQKFTGKSNAEFWNTPGGVWSGQWDKTKLDTQGHRDVSGGAFIPQTNYSQGTAQQALAQHFFFFYTCLSIDIFIPLVNWEIEKLCHKPNIQCWLSGIHVPSNIIDSKSQVQLCSSCCIHCS